VNPDLQSTSSGSRWLGTTCCLLSALCYTAANICLRQLAEIRIDPTLVICIKETVAVAVVGPWVLRQISRGVHLPCPGKALAILVVAGLAVQLIGNLGIQWAFGVIGLTISMPLVFGVMLVGSAMIGRLVFGEFLPPRSAAAVAVVIGSVVLLNIGAAGQDRWSELPAAVSNPIFIFLGIAAACAGGITFASLGAAVRYAAGHNVPVSITVVVVTGIGASTLGIISAFRVGATGLPTSASHAFAWMIASGVFNLFAFALITKGLQLTTLLHANVLNASQVALGATAGILLFHEPYNHWILIGITLTITGITLFGQPRARRKGAELSTAE
jgi:DME family drug/metabolite transporter